MDCKHQLIATEEFCVQLLKSNDFLRSQIIITADETKAIDCKNDVNRLNNDESDTELKFDVTANILENAIVIIEEDNMNCDSNESNYSLNTIEFADTVSKLSSTTDELLTQSIKEQSTTKKYLYKCTHCTRQFSEQNSYQRHQNYHKTNKTKCPICPRMFSHKSNLKRHLAIHKDKIPLKCDKCDKIFSQPNDLYEHMKFHRFTNAASQSTNKSTANNTDKSEYLLKCEHCNEETISYAMFYHHMQTVHNVIGKIKPFECNVCKMRFASKQGMYRHIDNIHENNRKNLRNREKNFLCITCGKKFHTNFHLNVHVRSHTGERPYACNVCNKSFSQISGLKMHSFIHTGERRFSCKFCSKTFVQYGHVREHLLTHSEERKHMCTVCGASFRVKGNLTAHIEVHRNKKPHVCDLCGKRFLQNSKLRQHLTKNHNSITLN